MEKEQYGIVCQSSERAVVFLRPVRQWVSYYMPCISARIQGTGLENPRFPHEAPKTRMTLETRQRQLHDEDKSCGSNPRISE